MSIETEKSTAKLTPELAEELRALFKKEKDSVANLALRAHQIRELGMDGPKYSIAFKRWWQTHKLDNQFRGKANFTKYAKAGSVLHRYKESEFYNKLPASLSALYALHLVIEKGLDVEQAVKCDDIRPNSTAAEIAGLVKRNAPERSAPKGSKVDAFIVSLPRSVFQSVKGDEPEAKERIRRLNDDINAALAASGFPFEIKSAFPDWIPSAHKTEALQTNVGTGAIQ